jgi:hypothetical protein
MWIDILCALINIVPLLSNFFWSCVTSWRFPFPFIVLHTIFLLFLAIAIGYVFFNHLLHVCEIRSSYMLVFWNFYVEFLWLCTCVVIMVTKFMFFWWCRLFWWWSCYKKILLKWIMQVQPFLMDITTSSQQMFESWFFNSFCITQI